MPSLTIRDLPERLHERLKARAAAHRRSVDDEARSVLGEALGDPIDEHPPGLDTLLDELERFHASLPPDARSVDPTAWIRQDRDDPNR